MFIANSLHRNYFDGTHPYIETALRCTPILGLFINRACIAHDKEYAAQYKLSQDLLYKKTIEHFKYSQISEVLGMVFGSALVCLGIPAAYCGIALAITSLFLFAISTSEKTNYRLKYEVEKNKNTISKRDEIIKGFEENNDHLDMIRNELERELQEQIQIKKNLEIEKQSLEAEIEGLGIVTEHEIDNDPRWIEVEALQNERDKVLNAFESEIQVNEEEIDTTSDPATRLSISQKIAQLQEQQILTRRDYDAKIDAIYAANFPRQSPGTAQ